LQRQLSVCAVRFQYRGLPERRGNWENMPFYLRYLRRFLAERDGDAVWLKGNTGGDEAAYLIFLENLREEIAGLLSRPLAELGSYEITAEPEPVEVLRKFYRDGKIGVGRLLFWEEQVGEEILDKVTEMIRRGFWLAAPNTPTARCGALGLRAKSVTRIVREDGVWLCFHEAEETHCRSTGEPVYVKQYPELWVPLRAIQDLAIGMMEFEAD